MLPKSFSEPTPPTPSYPLAHYGDNFWKLVHQGAKAVLVTTAVAGTSFCATELLSAEQITYLEAMLAGTAAGFVWKPLCSRTTATYNALIKATSRQRQDRKKDH